MRLDFEIKGLDEVKANLARLSGAESDMAIQMGINRTADKGRAEVNRAVLERYAIKADEVRGSVIVRPAHKRQAVAEAFINIFGSPSRRGRSMNMIHFLSVLASQHKTRGGRAKKGEIKSLAGQLGFRILKAGGIKQIPGAFVGNNGRTVFKRLAGKYMSSRSGQTKHSEALNAVRVVGVSQMFNSRAIRTRVMTKITEDMATEINRAINAVIARRK